MKRFSLLIIATFAGLFSFAQSLEQINSMMGANNYSGARTAIDAHLADPKNAAKGEGWYYKGRIYNALSREATTSPDQKLVLKTAAFDAFKKNQELDPKELQLKLEMYKSYLDLYFGLYDLGATSFNANNFDLAFNAFTKALEIKDYIVAKNYMYEEAKLYPLDTALVLNSAIAASQAKKEDQAIKYYRMLTDANISDKNYEQVYETLVNQYSRKDDPQLIPLLEKAKRFYPQNEYWAEVEIRQVAKSGDDAAMFAKYDELLAKNPTNYTLSYNYAVELYNSIYKGEAKTNQESAKAKLTEVLKKAIANDKGIDATMLMSNHLFNTASDLSISSSTTKDAKKKKELMDASNKMMDEFIPYGEAAVKFYEAMDPKTMKPVQKANYKIVLGYLSDVYNAKKNPKKAEEYDKKKSSFNM